MKQCTAIAMLALIVGCSSTTPPETASAKDTDQIATNTTRVKSTVTHKILPMEPAKINSLHVGYIKKGAPSDSELPTAALNTIPEPSDHEMRADVINLLEQEYATKKKALKDDFILELTDTQLNTPKYKLFTGKHYEQKIAELEQVLSLAQSGWFSKEDMQSVTLSLSRFHLLSEKQQIEEYREQLLAHEKSVAKLKSEYLRDEHLLDVELNFLISEVKVEGMIADTFKKTLSDIDADIKRLDEQLEGGDGAEDWTITETDLNADEETRPVDLNAFAEDKV